MGYGSEAASSVASGAGDAISSAGGGAFNAMQAADTAQFAGNMASGADTMSAISNASGGTAANAPVGGSMASIGASSEIGPTAANAQQLPQAGMMDTVKGWFKDYAAGGEQDFGQALDNAGFNMKTAGYIGKKIPTGGAPAMPQMNIPQGQAAGTTTDPMEHFRKRRMQYGGY